VLATSDVRGGEEVALEERVGRGGEEVEERVGRDGAEYVGIRVCSS
jgi:hypothetical protein